VRALFSAALAAVLSIMAATAQDLPQSPAVTAPTGTPLQTQAEALTQDAAAYAVLFGLSLAEAEQRLRAQEASVAITEALKATYRDRLAGVSIEQQPVFRIVVLLTGEQPVATRTVVADGLAVPVMFRTGAAATLDQLAAALKARQADLRAALAHPPGIGIDQRAGVLVIFVAGTDADAEDHDALTARLATIAGMPVRVQSIDRPSVDQAAEGGGRLVGRVAGDPHRYLCTAGFAVTNGERDGIATAAHCPDDLAYVDAAGRDHPMTFVGQWGWGFQDVQINASDEPLAPEIIVDTARTLSRPIVAQRAAAATRAGDVVCHRGERTGYSCGVVELTSFAPAGDLCGGACSPTWVTVAGPQCGGGDSGAPVFVATTALGILKGGSYRADGGCSFYFYMPLDYLPDGWHLLVAPAPPPTYPSLAPDPPATSASPSPT
jgi:hypothetical protein